MNIVHKKVGKEDIKLKTEKFFTHPIGVFIAAIVATFLWGSAFPFIKLSYAELGIQPQEVGEQILFVGLSLFSYLV